MGWLWNTKAQRQAEADQLLYIEKLKDAHGDFRTASNRVIADLRTQISSLKGALAVLRVDNDNGWHNSRLFTDALREIASISAIVPSPDAPPHWAEDAMSRIAQDALTGKYVMAIDRCAQATPKDPAP